MDGTFPEILTRGAKKLQLHLNEEALHRLGLYFQELQRWNKKINLIAKGSTELAIIENHFLDSLTLIPYLKGSNVHLIDVGTGAGFPGLVCGAVLPEISITLIEPRLKRVSFLRHIVRTLNLQQVEVVAERIEKIELLPTSAYDSYITSRAVTDIASFLNMIKDILPQDPTIICMKGAKWQEEVKGVKDILTEYSLELFDKKLFELPFSKAQRALLVYKGK